MSEHKARCPHCGSSMLFKIARDKNGLIVAHCLDCQRNARLTNKEYYGEQISQQTDAGRAHSLR